jgi:hypothetical protein
MTIKSGRVKAFLAALGLVVAGWGLIVLIGYGLLRGLLSFMDTEEDS